MLKCGKDGCNNEPVALVTGRTSEYPYDVNIATDGVNVYWADSAANDPARPQPASGRILFKCPVAGGSAPEAININVGSNLVRSGSHAYWNSMDGVYSCALSDCVATATTLWTNGGAPMSTAAENVVADEGIAYFLTMAPYGLRSCPSAGCNNQPVTVMSGAPQVYGITSFTLAVDAQYLYLVGIDASQSNLILRCAKTGCGNNPTTIVAGLSGMGASNLMADGQYLYWTESGTLPQTTGEGQAMIRKCSVPDCSSQPITVVAGLNAPGPLAIDDAYVYWIDHGSSSSDGQIWKALK